MTQTRLALDDAPARMEAGIARPRSVVLFGRTTMRHIVRDPECGRRRFANERLRGCEDNHLRGGLGCKIGPTARERNRPLAAMRRKPCAEDGPPSRPPPNGTSHFKHCLDAGAENAGDYGDAMACADGGGAGHGAN